MASVAVSSSQPSSPMSSRSVRTAWRAGLATLAAWVALSACSFASAADCAEGVWAQSADVALCVRSRGNLREVILTTLRAVELSAEAGVEVLSCGRSDRACRSMMVHTTPGESFPPVLRFDFQAHNGGRYRIDYGVCDKAEEVCIPGSLTVTLPQRN
jgi:hypothetical protein